MKYLLLIPAAVALSLSLSVAGPAAAQGNEAAQEQAHRAAQEANLRRQGLPLHYAQNDPRYRDGRDMRERGYRRGDRLASDYRNKTYIVEDWRAHRLTRPPRGYHWVQVGGDYALVADGSWVVRQYWNPQPDPANSAN